MPTGNLYFNELDLKHSDIFGLQCNSIYDPMETMRTGESLISASHCPENSSVICNLCQEASGKFIDFCFFEGSEQKFKNQATYTKWYLRGSLTYFFFYYLQGSFLGNGKECCC